VLVTLDFSSKKYAAGRRLVLAANRSYLIFMDFKGRETSRVINDDRRPDLTVTVDDVVKHMRVIAGTRPIGFNRACVLERLAKSRDPRTRRMAQGVLSAEAAKRRLDKREALKRAKEKATARKRRKLRPN
jgi:hypothetical protein